MAKSFVILRVAIPGQHDVELQKHGAKSYAVTYGLQTTKHTTLVGAIAAYESCVIHAVTCNGMLD